MYPSLWASKCHGVDQHQFPSCWDIPVRKCFCSCIHAHTRLYGEAPTISSHQHIPMAPTVTAIAQSSPYPCGTIPEVPALLPVPGEMLGWLQMPPAPPSTPAQEKAWAVVRNLYCRTSTTGTTHGQRSGHVLPYCNRWRFTWTDDPGPTNHLSMLF